MSKLGISLCVVLLALATKAAFLPDNLEIAQRNVQTIINETLFELQEKSNAAKNNLREKSLTVSDKGGTISENFWDDILSILSTGGSTAWVRIAKDKGVDIDTCHQLDSHLVHLANNITSQMETCISDTIHSELMDLEKIIKTKSAIAFANLTKIKEEVQHCGDNDHGQKSNVAAISCVKAAEVKIPSVVVTLVSVLDTQKIRLDKIVATLDPIPTACEISVKLKNFRQEKSVAEERVNNCIQEKINAAEINRPQSP